MKTQQNTIFHQSTHPRSLNFRRFGIADATRLKMRRRGHLQWHHLSTIFHENPPISSKVISGRHTHTHTHTDLISLLSFLESRLKILCPSIYFITSIYYCKWVHETYFWIILRENTHKENWTYNVNCTCSDSRKRQTETLRSYPADIRPSVCYSECRSWYTPACVHDDWASSTRSF
jgi:hypothetical protein